MRAARTQYSAHAHLLRTGGEVAARLVRVGKQARRLDDQRHAQRRPRQLRRRARRHERNVAAVDDQRVCGERGETAPQVETRLPARCVRAGRCAADSPCAPSPAAARRDDAAPLNAPCTLSQRSKYASASAGTMSPTATTCSAGVGLQEGSGAPEVGGGRSGSTRRRAWARAQIRAAHSRARTPRAGRTHAARETQAGQCGQSCEQMVARQRGARKEGVADARVVRRRDRPRGGLWRRLQWRPRACGCSATSATRTH